jgi:hypothetical protein
MKKPHDPDRLENQGSAELTSMLQALRGDGPTRASMQRMGQSLKSTFEAAPATGTAVRPISSRMLGKIGVTLLASGALFFAVRYVTHRPNDAGPDALAAQAPSVVKTAQAAPEHAATQAPPETVARSAPQPDLEPQPSSASRPMAEGQRATRARSARHARAAHVGSATSWAASRAPEPSRVTDSESAAEEHAPLPDASGESDRAVSATADRDGARPVEQTTVQPAASSTPEPAVREPVRVASRSSEASLLQRAQRLAGDRPTEALRILAEHARVYPNGILAPEREVLAIQILRAQSRTAEANSRLTAFRQHYPDSVYLERLEQRTQQPRSP